MDPVSLTAVVSAAGMGASALGSMTQASGQLYAGQAQSNMFTYQAGVARLNQQIAKQNADYAIEAGEVRAQESGMKTAAEVGQTKAIQGASNIDVRSGSAAAVRTSEIEVGAQNQAIIRSDAARKAYGYQVEGMQAGAQADIYGMAAEQAKKAGGIAALGSILGGASSVSSKWLQGSSVGLWGGSSDTGPVSDS